MERHDDLRCSRERTRGARWFVFSLLLISCSSSPASDRTAVDDAGARKDATPSADDGSDAPGNDATSMADAGSVPASDAGAVPFELIGCTVENGPRPATASTSRVPAIAKVLVTEASSGMPLQGTVTFATGATGQPAQLIVQVEGRDDYHVCPIDQASWTAGEASLSQLSVADGVADSSALLQVALRDAAGQAGPYVTTVVSVGKGASISVCSAAPAPVQLAGRVASASTDFYAMANGNADYSLAPGGERAKIVRRTAVPFDRGECDAMWLSADAAGEKPVGWDNCLVVELRTSPGSETVDRWAYNCALYHEPTTSNVPMLGSPSVPGSTLDPPVPNSAPFGFPAGTIDVFERVPADLRQFELTLLVLDYGVVGSTTDIWGTPGSRPRGDAGP